MVSQEAGTKTTNHGENNFMTITQQLLFWSKVEKTPSCWNWKGYLNREGDLQ